MILYYPFILLVIATILIMVDQPFVLKLFKSVSLEEMWRLVVMESGESPHIQRQRLQHAMSVSSGGYFISYLSRTILSLILSILPITLLSLYLTELDSGVYKCQVHDIYYYECAGIPAQLYKVIILTEYYQPTNIGTYLPYVLFQFSTLIVIILLSLYFLLNLYNTAWLLVPSMGKLRRIMRNFRKKSSAKTSSQLEEFYYKNRDVRLLLNLLTDSQGLASPLRCLSLIDQTFHDDLSPILTRSKFWLVSSKSHYFLSFARLLFRLCCGEIPSY